mmetsp:Transcript_57621/g.100828  ORF Transcript_57621/g.100828 Transcript_57621/m.100828 type:complete len:83 (+) Transcript_57621:509-757(+)
MILHGWLAAQVSSLEKSLENICVEEVAFYSEGVLQSESNEKTTLNELSESMLKKEKLLCSRKVTRCRWEVGGIAENVLQLRL